MQDPEPQGQSKAVAHVYQGENCFVYLKKMQGFTHQEIDKYRYDAHMRALEGSGIHSSRTSPQITRYIETEMILWKGQMQHSY